MSLQFRPYCGQFWSSDEVGAANCVVPWNKLSRQVKGIDNSLMRGKRELRRAIRVHGKYLGPGSGQMEESRKNSYHPFEDILDSEETGFEDRRLTAAETSRTIVEVNSKATLMFTGMVDDGVVHNIFWPDLPYLTDEHGNIYFQVNIEEDVMQTLTSEDNYVHVILGVDTKETLNEIVDFGLEEIEEEDTDFDEEDENIDDDDDDDDDDEIIDFGGMEWGDVSEHEDYEGQADSDSSLGDWAELETMRSSHPLNFATKIAEAKLASDNPLDYMKQPQNGLAIQGLIRPALIEEQSGIQMHRSDHESDESEYNFVLNVEKPIEDKGKYPGEVNGHADESISSGDHGLVEDIEKDNSQGNGKIFYKLEMTKIELILASGHQTVVEVEEYRKSRPDVIAHSASRIISRVNASGEKTTQALKSLCRRCKGIHVEEASLVGLDSLGFDLRVCSGTQIQTLRFAFSSRATSEYSAERQLNDLLLPRSNQKPQKVKQAQQKEG